MATTINIAPRREGYLAAGAVFAAQIVADISKTRVHDDVAILRTLLDIAYCTGARDAEDARESGDFTLDSGAVIDALLSRCPRSAAAAEDNETDAPDTDDGQVCEHCGARVVCKNTFRLA